MARLAKATFRAQIAQSLRAAILTGALPPGAAIVETQLAAQFKVSRAPLREALRELIEEGLLTAVPYTGTKVTELSVLDLREIQSMRITLERFAFELVWPRRDAAFRQELHRRHGALTRAIDLADEAACVSAELALHGWVYEFSGHRLLQRTWHGLQGRLQLYWSVHHRAHGNLGPKRDSHQSYLSAASGRRFETLSAEIEHHMQRGAAQTELLLLAHALAQTPAQALTALGDPTGRTQAFTV